MNPRPGKWLKIAFFNLLLVAFLGMIMRYKIAYSLPFIDQRNLLHAHSHFAFAGWITQALMSMLISFLVDKGDTTAFARYRLLLYSNLISAYGMLLTFPFTGYALLSISFSTLSIFVSYWFAIKYWIDLNKLPQRSVSHKWFKAAVIFNAISSLGAFSLAYMLATKNISANRYLASVYFFLHFQYNGWFFFACMGLLSHQLRKYGIDELRLRRIFSYFAVACIPAYFLSALWLPIPKWVYVMVVIAVCFQLVGWMLALQAVKKALSAVRKNIPAFPRVLFGLSGLALTIKLLLQACSVIPSLSQLAFGFRPIVIGYLHLVLLGVITIFIIGYSVAFRLIELNPLTKKGIIVFVCGVIINEGLLMLQGITDMSYKPVPFVNQFLLVAALILFTGMLLINFSQQFGRYDPTHKRSEKN